MKARIRNGESTPSTRELFLKQHSHAVEAINMSAQELADLESLYADGVLDGDLDDFVEASLAARVGAQREG